MIALSCPSCSKRLTAKEELAGKRCKCPACGTYIQVPANTPPAIGCHQEQGWSLRERVLAAYNGPLLELSARIQQAQGLLALVDANDPLQFERACTAGLSAVGALSLDTSTPTPLRNALHDIPNRRQELLSLIHPASQAVNKAGAEVRNLDLPQGMAGFFHGAAKAANPTTSAGLGALGGATIGTILLPGIGTAIGGALGGFFGAQHSSKRDQAVLESFDSATRMMWAAVQDLYRSMWNRLIHALQEAGDTALPDAAYYETATSRWEELKNRLLPDVRIDNIASFRQEVERFIKYWGPHPEALYLAGRSCLPPYPDDPAISTGWVSVHLRVFPQHPGAYENAADLALERGDFKLALAMADQGLTVDPTYSGLAHSRIEILASLGRNREAESAMQAALRQDSVSPRFSLIRGLMRAGRHMDAMGQVRNWVQQDGKPAVIARALAGLPLTAPLVTDDRLRIVEFSRIPLGIDGELRGIVEQYLSADGLRFYFDELPLEKTQNAREAFLQLQTGETLLFFYDWSFWQNAKTGFVITNKRVLWKCLWEPPVAIPLRQLVFQSIRAEQSVLHVNNNKIDIEDANLAASFAQALLEMCRHWS